MKSQKLSSDQKLRPYMLSIVNFKRTAVYSTRTVDRVFATKTVNSGSIPGRVKPKTTKIDIHSFPT